MPELSDHFDQFLRERIYLHNVTPKTAEWSRSVWRIFATWWDRLPTEARIRTVISRPDLQAFVVHLRERGVKPVSCNCYPDASARERHATRRVSKEPSRRVGSGTAAAVSKHDEVTAMRKNLLLPATVVLLLQTDEHGRAQASLIGGVYWAPNTARRVTISQQGRAVAELSFPSGVFLDAMVTGSPPVTAPGRWVFKGDVRLRAAPSDESAPGQAPGRTLAERMSQAPFVLTMKDAEVVVENVGVVRNAP